MLGWFAASLPARRSPLALGLCLLAILFALEAKTAWYGPAAGPGSDIRAAKALPVGSPELVEHGLPAPDPAHPHASFAALPDSVLTPFLWAGVPAISEILRGQRPIFSPAHLSPALFFRPPPVF